MNELWEYYKFRLLTKIFSRPINSHHAIPFIQLRGMHCIPCARYTMYWVIMQSVAQNKKAG